MDSTAVRAGYSDPKMRELNLAVIRYVLTGGSGAGTFSDTFSDEEGWVISLAEAALMPILAGLPQTYPAPDSLAHDIVFEYLLARWRSGALFVFTKKYLRQAIRNYTKSLRESPTYHDVANLKGREPSCDDHNQCSHKDRFEAIVEAIRKSLNSAELDLFNQWQRGTKGWGQRYAVKCARSSAWVTLSSEKLWDKVRAHLPHPMSRKEFVAVLHTLYVLDKEQEIRRSLSDPKLRQYFDEWVAGIRDGDPKLARLLQDEFGVDVPANLIRELRRLNRPKVVTAQRPTTIGFETRCEFLDTAYPDKSERHACVIELFEAGKKDEEICQELDMEQAELESSLQDIHIAFAEQADHFWRRDKADRFYRRMQCGRVNLLKTCAKASLSPKLHQQASRLHKLARDHAKKIPFEELPTRLGLDRENTVDLVLQLKEVAKIARKQK